MKFANPYLLLLLVPLTIFVVFYYKNSMYLAKSSLLLNAGAKDENSWIRYFPFLRYIALAFVIFAVASPFEEMKFIPDETKGIDIMVAIDVSGSMAQSKDFRPGNRLEVAKSLLTSFIEKRTEDRVGLVVFGGTAYLQSPLTSDINSLKEIVSEISPGMVREDGTAIGDALILSVYRLKDSKAKSRVIVLLTDGASNSGKFDPTTAAEITADANIKAYTIGIGNNTEEVNFSMLEKIATMTYGKFYRAKSPTELIGVLNIIDSLEKDVLPKRPEGVVEQKYGIWLFLGLLLILADTLIRTFYKKYYV